MCNYIQSEGGSQTGKLWNGGSVICDICKAEEPDCFVDGRLRRRTQWANMCMDCFKTHGAGLGIGKGQKYCKKQ